LVDKGSHRRGFGLLAYDDADLTATLADAVLDNAVDLGEEGVIAATADVETRVDPGTALTNENRSRSHRLAIEGLGAEPLCR
jgi:hypothetical protein